MDVREETPVTAQPAQPEADAKPTEPDMTSFSDKHKGVIYSARSQTKLDTVSGMRKTKLQNNKITGT